MNVAERRLFGTTAPDHATAPTVTMRQCYLRFTLQGRGYLGAPADDTGLTLLGARYYDPGTGTFLSPDSLLDPMLPAQFNAYVYSANNPVTWAGPSGQLWTPGTQMNPDHPNPTVIQAPVAVSTASTSASDPSTSSNSPTTSSAHSTSQSPAWDWDDWAQLGIGIGVVLVGAVVIVGGIACVVATAGICAAPLAAGGATIAGGGVLAGTTVTVGAVAGTTAAVGGAGLVAGGAGIVYNESQQASGGGSVSSAGYQPSGGASGFDRDELAQLIRGHAGADDKTRPTLEAIRRALSNGTAIRIPGQNAVRIDYRGVRVIINEDIPWRSMAYIP